MKPTRPDSLEGDKLERSALEAIKRLERIPYLKTRTLALSLASGANVITHGMGRRPSGWLAHSQLGGLATVTAVDASTMSVTASATMTLTLEVW